MEKSIKACQRSHTIFFLLFIFSAIGWCANFLGFFTGVSLANVVSLYAISVMFAGLRDLLEASSAASNERKTILKQQKAIFSLLHDGNSDEMDMFEEKQNQTVETQKEPETNVVYDKAHMSDVYLSTRGE